MKCLAGKCLIALHGVGADCPEETAKSVECEPQSHSDCAKLDP